jgi:hypothetical protein
MTDDFDPTRGTFSNVPPVETPSLEKLLDVVKAFHAKSVPVRLETANTGLSLLRAMLLDDPTPVPVPPGGIPVIVSEHVPPWEARFVFSDGRVQRFDLRTGKELLPCSK